MKTTSFCIALALLASCNPQPKETKEQTEAPEATAPKTDTVVNCYQYAAQGDTIALKLTRAGENVTGTLAYLFKEKDSNKGTIEGSIKGDLLVGNYTFMSEGTQSTRQVAFKQTGNSFVEGYGESVEENGVMKFKNVDSLTFGTSLKLEEVTCK